MGLCSARSVSKQLVYLGMWLCNALLEKDWSEARVEGAKTLLLEDLAHSADEAIGEGGVGDKTNTGSFERAEGNVGEELGATGGGKVDGGAVVGGSLIPEQRDGLLLEELVSAELESTLKKVAGECWASTSEEGTGAFFGDDLAEATDQATVVGHGVELDARLHTTHRHTLSVFVSMRH